ncbi:hypothetical protein [Streptomyces sp. NPDC002490]|uniref:hypothetical protein n=1 Tax=Streptomyces sp. NPDC002490 TaxID=3154416 RepID=UPI00331D9BAF
MTTSTDPKEHPSVEEVSDLTEGLLAADRAADLRLHLDTCQECAEICRSLEEIRLLLGDADQPESMPADVVSRIDHALAAETGLPGGTPPRVSRETRGARPPRRGERPGRRRRSRRAALLGAALTALLGTGGLLAWDGGADPRPEIARTTFSEDTLPRQVAELLTPAETGAGEPSPLRAPLGGTAGLYSDTPVPACVQDAIGRTDPVLAVQEGTYRSQAVYLVVLPHASDSSQVSAYVVDASCDGPGELLFTRSYPR